MNTEEFKKNNGSPVKDVIAFYWINPDKIGDFDIPFHYFEQKKLQNGRACLGRVVAVGPDAEFLKEYDMFYFNEYEADTGMWLKDNEVYFIEEKNIEIKFLKTPKEWVSRT